MAGLRGPVVAVTGMSVETLASSTGAARGNSWAYDVVSGRRPDEGLDVGSRCLWMFMLNAMLIALIGQDLKHWWPLVEGAPVFLNDQDRLSRSFRLESPQGAVPDKQKRDERQRLTDDKGTLGLGTGEMPRKKYTPE